MDRRLVGQEIVQRTPRPAPPLHTGRAPPQGCAGAVRRGGRVAGDSAARHHAARNARRRDAASRTHPTGAGANGAAAAAAGREEGIAPSAEPHVPTWFLGAARRKPGSPASTNETPRNGTERRP